MGAAATATAPVVADLPRPQNPDAVSDAQLSPPTPPAESLCDVFPIFQVPKAMLKDRVQHNTWYVLLGEPSVADDSGSRC